MSKPFDMDLFLAGVLTGSHATRQPGNAMYARRKSSRLNSQIAGSDRRLGLGRKSIWTGFLSIA